MIHLQRWAIAFGAAISAYLVYVTLAVPWLEPPPLKARATKPLEVATKRKEHDLSHLFAADSWQLQQPKVIETDTCLVLFHDYKTLPDGKVEVTPCAVVLFQGEGDEARERPIVLDAPAGAVLQFSKEVDLGGSELGQIQGGRLPGDIRIFQPPSSPQANDGLELLTRNVQIDQSRIWTPHEVRFKHGNSHGSGRDLAIYLTPQDMIGGDADPIANLQRLVLAVVDVMHLEQEGKGLLGEIDEEDSARPPAIAQADAAEAQPPLEIRCEGPFQFDFINATGTFDDRVVVTRLNPIGPPDSLHCDRLSIWFEKEKESQEDLSPAAAARLERRRRLRNRANGGEDQQLSNATPFSGTLSRIEAVGKQVLLEAPSVGAGARGQRLTFDFQTRQIALKPGHELPQVTLQHGPNTLTAAQVEYELPEQGQLGTMWAEGPGDAQLWQEQKEKPVAINVHWEKEIRLRPHENMKVLSLLGSAKVQAVDTGGLAADEIHLWLEEVANPTAAASQMPVASANPANVMNPAAAMSTIRPDRLLALGNVELNTTDMTGHTKRLEAWFVPAAPGDTIPFPAPVASPPASNRLGRAAGPRLDLRRSLPEDIALTDRSIQRVTALRPIDEEPAAPVSHFDVTGELVRARLVFGGKTVMAEDLAVEGNVHVEETKLADPEEMPVMIDGDVLQLQKGSTPDATMQVVGQPARVLARGLKLKGGSITVRRSDNKAWMQGPGEAELPLDASQMGNPFGEKAKPPTAPPPPADPNAPQPTARVQWQKGLVFDGQVLTVLGKVLVRTEKDLQVMATERLIATFDEHIDFLHPPKGASPEVAKIQADGGVFLQNRSFDERWQQTSFDQFQVQNFTFEKQTGTLHADGPGWLTSSRVGGATLGPTAPGAGNPASKSDGLTYLKVTFQGDVVGNLNTREIQFQRQVRTVFGPIARWEDKFEPQAVEDLGDNGVSLASDRLTVVQMQVSTQQPKWIELEASGNALVEGKIFTAQAQRIAYSAAKEQLVLEGDGRTDSELWYRPGKGQPNAYQAARKITFMQSNGSITVEDGKAINLNNLGGLNVPRVPGLR